MFFQIEKVILWSKDTKMDPRVINFALNKVNLITGASKTGKSSLIPIIDYCLGASKCSIPVNTIRDATAWYGVQVKTGNSRLLIARKDPGNQKSTSNTFFIEADEIELPKFIDAHNRNIDQVKDRLNEIIGVSNIDFDFHDTGRLDKLRTSVRDMAAFNYQPQNIVANPNALFYKTDSFEHKNKLITILPYILGALDNEDLEKIHKLNLLEEDYKRIERRYLKLKQQNSDWIATAQAYLIRAVEMGLVKISKEINRHSPEQLLFLLNRISEKDIDISTAASNIKFASDQERLLNVKSKEISHELGKIKSRVKNLASMKDATENHAGVAYIKRNRLSLSKWLLEQRDEEHSLFSEPNEIKKLVLEPLAKAFDSIEPRLKTPENIEGILSRERVYLDSELSRLTAELKDVNDQLRILRGDKKQHGYDTFSVGRFIGELDNTLKSIGETDDESLLAKEYKKLKQELEDLKSKVNPQTLKQKTALQLQIVNKLATDWLPSLDTENPYAPISLSEKELTIKVNHNGREDYLWEIGSGANWVSYHVAISLALHQHFSTLKQSPVPNYIIYDQPSQVYFPSKLNNQTNSSNGQEVVTFMEQDEDILQVKKIFRVFSEAIKKTHENLQIIVLDHAPSTLVTELDNGHLVEVWRDGIKLVPVDWLK
ncbi:hypothetical protein J2X32_000978 [Rheinheimera pacifica]|uniref:DUF3732 domain-containing protein n=1 Tax=Rheinheimera pacifica TaxID=173990 RepID=UPI002859D96A|nr:DUF3732 domain-containing protein [Rheinheimera pacifica]MDR6982360.1 hypothetical protein [Rheinheimera pacifica]